MSSQKEVHRPLWRTPRAEDPRAYLEGQQAVARAINSEVYAHRNSLLLSVPAFC